MSFMPAPLSSLVVPREVHVANVEPEESEPQPDGHAIAAEMVLAHVCSRCRKCLMASACARHRLALGGAHRTARPPRQDRVCHSGRISHAPSSADDQAARGPIQDICQRPQSTLRGHTLRAKADAQIDKPKPVFCHRHWPRSSMPASAWSALNAVFGLP